MHYIDNGDLREWVKEKLRKAIFQKAHALAVQTGCEILVKLDDTTSGSQYYASNTLQRAFKHGGIHEKPGDLYVCGETGLPVVQTADIAIQSCANDDDNNDDVNAHKNNSIVNSSFAEENRINCKSTSSTPGIVNSEGSVIPLCLTVTSDSDDTPAQFHSVQQSYSKSPSVASEQTDTSDTVLDFSVKNQASETEKSKETETGLSQSGHGLTIIPSVTENSKDVAAMETEQSQIAVLLQRPGLIQMEVERHSCQMCSRSFPKSQLLRDHISRSHMQPSMPIVQQKQQTESNTAAMYLLSQQQKAAQSAIPIVPIGGLDHLPDHIGESSSGLLTYPSSLPTYSTLVQEALSEGTVQQVWDQFIRETTDFYFPEMPQEDGKARLAYQHIGRTMYEKYPCILGEGPNPWSHFNKALSSRIRWRRQKRKYQTDPGGGGSTRPSKRPNSSPAPSDSSVVDEAAPALSTHSEEELDVKPNLNELNRQILLSQLSPHVHLPSDPSTSAAAVAAGNPSSGAMSPPMIDYGIPAKGLKKNILMQTGFYLTADLAAMGFSSTLKMTADKVKPLLKQMAKEGYGIWAEDPVNKEKCGFIKWYPLNEMQQSEVSLTNEQYKRACVAKPQMPRVLSKEMEQFFDSWGGRKVRQNMSLL